MRFDEPVTVEQRADLQGSGITLLRYVGNHAYFASIAPGTASDEALALTPSLVDATRIDTAWKLDPRMTSGEVPAHALVRETSRR